MSTRYRVLSAKELTALHDGRRDFAYDVLVGLSERPKRIGSKWFYDDEGSRLFQQIMALEEYYPTACEREILETSKRDFLQAVGDRPFNLIDLGAGDGAKTKVLLSHFAEARARFRYVPIDISEGAMKTLTDDLAKHLPNVEVQGLVAEYADGVHWVGAQDAARRNVVLFLGSNIGNFDRARARAFLRRLWNAARPDDLLYIGFDLKKDIEVLLRAYNDSEGVTSAFNLNLLRRINRELDGDFDLDKWRHFGTYEVRTGAMESYLVSCEAQVVTVGAIHQRFEFEAWEPIHTEYSYKYHRTDIEQLAADTGFVIETEFEDTRGWFVGSLWRVDKPV